MSAEVWKLSAAADRARIEAALDRQAEAEDWDADIAVSGQEIEEQRPDEWMFEAWMPRRPRKADQEAIAALFETPAPTFTAEKLPETDWLVESQKRVQPIRAGRFHVHTPDHDPSPAAVNFAIPASQAFGTGHHETTAGCLAMLDLMRREGVAARDIADIGTGTGLLAFAAMNLWPAAYATASDNDPVCLPVVEENARLNGIALGTRRGELAMLVAGGTDHPLTQARAPYDLLIANILARPLIDLAQDFAQVVAPGGSVLLAGLLETQEPAVRRAYRRAGFRLARRHVRGDWSILWLRKRRAG
ncbi:50S ribosomal protein L11 methyltransferase [Qipengyuania sp. MTN3-11]|uniref:50S ribosomal protein L11 methyltransferase n=1 Tax=Qipengyuania sp. MTN3-11 TaxID=3056557 RepID=UPI0036F3C820